MDQLCVDVGFMFLAHVSRHGIAGSCAYFMFSLLRNGWAVFTSPHVYEGMGGLAST